MSIIDAQVHVYERDHPGRPWAGGLVGPAEVTGDDMIAAMDAAGVDGAIVVSAFSMYRYDSSYAAEQCHAHPDRFALVVPVDPADPAVAETVARHADRRAAVGIRLLLNDADPDARSHPDIDAVARQAASHGLVVNLYGPAHLALVGRIAARNADTQFVVDHIGLEQPLRPPAPPDPWRGLDALLPLAALDNVAVKISNACTLSHEPFPYPDIWPPLARVFEAFGLDRCMWGSDWTRAVELLDYRQGVEAFRLAEHLTQGERAQLMGGTLSHIHRWSPTAS